MVLSLSPGPALPEKAELYKEILVSRLIVNSSNRVISPPMISGERITDHSVIIVTCSSLVNFVVLALS